MWNAHITHKIYAVKAPLATEIRRVALARGRRASYAPVADAIARGDQSCWGALYLG
jgi:hypothetical protein